MVIIITGASHVGKTLLAQKMLERYKFPYLSIDHLKMGLIRSGNTDLTPEDDDELTEYLWPIIREIIKTATENEQNLIVEKQFGDSDYGKIKYSKGAMFWIGYMYRYLSYTREVSTGFIMKLVAYKQLNDVYYSFHTQDPEWCAQSLLEMNHLGEEVFDNNLRLKNIIAERGNY